ncbi:MAG: AAA family ATPase, partial [Granulosicoccus sp.]|nr:AAA family ATPase [Granulosicoccus sp.]
MPDKPAYDEIMANTAANADADRHAGLLSEEALLALQLRTQPFTDAPADGDWFVDESVREQLGEIKDALISGDDLLLISGESGSGKSVLLKQLAGNSGPRIQCFSVRGSERFSTYNLFSGLLEAFKLTPPVEMDDTLKEVVPCMQALLERNTLGVIVLDDADEVPREELAKLIGSMRFLNSGEEPLLRILLAAKPDFESRLPDVLPSGDDLPYATLSVEPYDIDRTIGYLEFRLNQAGHFEEFPFSDKQLASICETGANLPAGLNVAAANEINALYAPASLRGLTPAATRSSGLWSGSATRGLLAMLALGLIGAGIYLFLPSTGGDGSARNADDSTAAAASDNYTVVSEKPIDTSPDKIALIDEKVEQPNENASNENTDQNRTDPSTTQSAVKASTENTPAPKPVATTSTATEPPAPRTTQASTDSADNTEAAASAESLPQANLENPNWVLVQDPKQYTVQMSASRDRESVAYFLQRTQLQAPNSIYSYQRNGQTWYALVHGLFPSITEARQMIE